jgi:multiple sugar transport system permease protein
MRQNNTVKMARFKELTKTYIPFYIMLLPFLTLFVLFMLIPVLVGIFMSFTDYNGLQMPNFVGLENYYRLLLQDDVFKIDIKNTLFLAFVTGPAGYILSFVVAWLINETGKNVRSVITLLMYSPALCGTLFFIWQYIFSGDSKGLINSMLFKIGIIRTPILWLSDPKYTMTVVIIVSIWFSFGVGFLSFLAGLRGLDRAYYEAAAIDGLKNRWQELFYVTFPQMGPQLMFGAVISISGAFSLGVINRQLTGFPSTNYSTDTILLHMQEYGTIRFEMGYASAIAVILFLMTLVSWFLIRKLLKAINAG